MVCDQNFLLVFVNGKPLKHDIVLLDIYMIKANFYQSSKLDRITDYDLLTLFRGVSIEFLQEVRYANRGCLFLWTPVPVSLGSYIYSYEEQFLPYLSYLFTFGHIA